jgi:hypothetical protein
MHTGSRSTAFLRINAIVVILMIAVVICGKAAAQTDALVVTSCGVSQVDTPSLRSSADYTATLKMHSEDDHGKNTHLCLAGYTLKISSPDRSSMQPFDIGQGDDAWNRPLRFAIDGFSADGNRAFVLILDGAYPQSIEAVDYDMKSGRAISHVFLDRRFTKRLTSTCAATLRIVGTTTTGHIVLGSQAKDGCSSANVWELSPNETTEPAGGRVLLASPKKLSSLTNVDKAEAGVPVRR